VVEEIVVEIGLKHLSPPTEFAFHHDFEIPPHFAWWKMVEISNS
jgi:hypothetical protein